jgi:hypothetical protein
VAVFATFLVALAGLEVLVFSRSRSQQQRQDLSLRVFVALSRFQAEVDGALIESVQSAGSVLRYRRLISDSHGVPALNPRGGLLYEASSSLALDADGWLRSRQLSGTPPPSPRRLAYLGESSSLLLVRSAGNLDVLTVDMTARDGNRFWKASRSLVLRGQR